MSKDRNPWLQISLDAWSLGMEASTVMGLRTLKLAVGDTAEAQRMFSEKLDAAFDLQRMAMTGGLGMSAEAAASRTLTHYRRRVKANVRRLSRIN